MKPEKVAELVAAGCARFAEPLLTRVKKLEQRSHQVAALEARIERLEGARKPAEPEPEGS